MKKTVRIIILAAAFAAVGLFVFIFWNSPEARMNRRIGEGNLEEAVKIYQNELGEPKLSDQTDKELQSAFQNIHESYMDGDMAREDAMAQCSLLVKFNDSGISEKLLAEIYFLKAERLAENLDYKSAIFNYRIALSHNSEMVDAEIRLKNVQMLYSAQVMEAADALEDGLQELADDAELKNK